MRIGIVVHGRFHSFDLARALLARGHDIVVYTNYPKWAAKRYGLPPERIRSFWLHGLVNKVVTRYLSNQWNDRLSPILHASFAEWAKRNVKARDHDIIYVFSGIAEPLLRAIRDQGTRGLLVRGSSHVRVQDEILREEEERAGASLERPGPRRIEQEEREYDLADRIVVLSTFAYDSFVSVGITPERLILLPLGVDTRRFRPSADVIEQRCARILSGAPLRVLTVGTLSFRKGLLDYIEVLNHIDHGSFEFRFVGNTTRDAARYSNALRHVELTPRQQQQELPRFYEWGDIFLFPTLEDGFAVVLAQANAAGLPILASKNSSARDLVTESINGWTVPIRNPGMLAERLGWCNRHRERLAEMVVHMYQNYRPRDWSDVAAAFEERCAAAFQHTAAAK